MTYPTILPTIGHDLAEEIDDSLAKALVKHAAFHTPHEGYAVMLEELDELWDEVRAWQPTNDNIAQMRKEAIHCAAMAIRFIQDVCDKPGRD